MDSATGVLKYASQRFSMIDIGKHLAVDVVQKMVLRLIDLLEGPSFTTITNSLYVLLQLLKNDIRLQSHVK